MKIQQLQYVDKCWKIYMHTDDFDRMQCQLVLAFGEPSLVTDTSVFNHLERSYPEAHIILCSTSGEIIQNDVCDNSVVVTAIQFNNTTIHCAETNIKNHQSSYEAGQYLMQQLQQKDLNAAFIISDGTCINGSELVAGFNETNHKQIPVTGGLAGDGARFSKTYVGLNLLPAEGVIVAIGFYGEQLKVGHGSFGGDSTMADRDTVTILNTKPELAILISCIGRKLILRDRTEEEVHAVNEILGTTTCTTGFYSHGEISPFNASSHCGLHNQTMTITTFTEL